MPFHGEKPAFCRGRTELTVEFLPYLIVCPLVCIAGFVDAIAGGGGLISLPAYLIAGIPVHMAIGTNKLSSCMGTTLATIRYGRKGFIPLKLAPFAVVCALAGSTIGAELALLIDDGVFKIVMLFILPLTAAYVFFGKGVSERENAGSLSFVKTVLITVAVAFFIGMYDGFYGPGTGTFMILFLVGAAKLRLSEANGLSKVMNLSTNIAALTVYLMNGKVIYPLGLTAGAFCILGNYLGTRLFTKHGAKSAKPIILIVLTIFFVKTVVELIQGT